MLEVSLFSEIILYKPNLILLFRPVMALQKPFHIAKPLFQQIGRIRDAKCGKIFKGKQPRQIPFQAVVGTMQLLVSI